MPYKTWVVGEEVLAADFNDYIQEQVVSTWASSAARTAGISSPTAGMVSYLLDSDRIECYDGTVWTPPRNTGWGFVQDSLPFVSTTLSAPGIVACTGDGSQPQCPVVGRKYLISMHATIALGSTADAQILMKSADSVVLSPARRVSGGTGRYGASVGFIYERTGTGTGIYTGFITQVECIAGGNVYVESGETSVIDVGPA